LKKDECVNANQIREWFCPLDGGANARAVACPPDTTCQLNAEGVALCQAGAPETCRNDADCPGQFCRDDDVDPDEQICMAKRENGAICARASYCVSGYCTPGGRCDNSPPPARKALNEECPTHQNAECQDGLVCRKLFVREDPTTWSGNRYFCNGPMPIGGICERPDQCLDTICRNSRCVERADG